VIAHTTGEAHQHIGLATESTMLEVIRQAGFLNFKFYYALNSKLARKSYHAARLISELPLLRGIFSEDLIVKIYKPVILSFFP